MSVQESGAAPSSVVPAAQQDGPPAVNADSVPGHAWRYFREKPVDPALVQAVRISGPFTVDGEHQDDGWLVLDADGDVQAVSAVDFAARFEAADPGQVPVAVAATEPAVGAEPAGTDESSQIQHGLEPLRVTGQGVTLARDPSAAPAVEADRGAGMPQSQEEPVGGGGSEPDSFDPGLPGATPSPVAPAGEVGVAEQGAESPAPVIGPAATPVPADAVPAASIAEGETSADAQPEPAQPAADVTAPAEGAPDEWADSPPAQ